MPLLIKFTKPQKLKTQKKKKKKVTILKENKKKKVHSTHKFLLQRGKQIPTTHCRQLSFTINRKYNTKIN